MEKIKILNFFLISMMLLWISNCGGSGTGGGMITFSPTEPLVLNVDRQIVNGLFFYTIPKPNVTFQIKIDNTGNPNPLVVAGLTLVVNGPSGYKVVPVDPTSNMFQYVSNNFSISPRAFIAEVPAYQANFCMNKISFLHEPDYSRSCADIGSDTTKISQYGVSAYQTTGDSGDPNCCPIDVSNMSNVFFIVGALQDLEDNNPLGQIQNQRYSITAHIQGLYGTFLNPVSNFSTQVTFTARAN